VTVRRLPRADAGMTNQLLVRVAIFTPLAFHTYVTDDGVGDHVPLLTVRVDPTRFVPVTVGRGAVKVPGATVVVAVLVTDLVVYSVRDPVTVTVSRFPFADAGTMKVFEVRVEIVTPFAFHTCFTDDGVGDQVPRLTVSVSPTFAVPVTVGRGAVKTPGLTVTVHSRRAGAKPLPPRYTSTIGYVPGTSSSSLSIRSRTCPVASSCAP